MIDITRLRGRQTIPTSSELLVDGTYGCAEARDLLTGLLQSVINHHKLQNLSAQVHTEQPDAGAQRSLQDLAAIGAEWRELLDARAPADGKGLRVRVRTTVELEVERDGV